MRHSDRDMFHSFDILVATINIQTCVASPKKTRRSLQNSGKKSGANRLDDIEGLMQVCRRTIDRCSGCYSIFNTYYPKEFQAKDKGPRSQDSGIPTTRIPRKKGPHSRKIMVRIGTPACILDQGFAWRVMWLSTNLRRTWNVQNDVAGMSVRPAYSI